jgi:hypothetical protein
MVGVTLEGFGGTDTRRPTFGAASRALYSLGGKARVSVQPEANLPIVRDFGNLSVAAGIASAPAAFHGSLCYRHLELVSYGGCGHWYSDGSFGADLNLSLFVPVLFAKLDRVH